MTEAYLHALGGDIVEAESAGIEPGTLNQTVVELLKEEGIDITGKKTQSVFDLHAAGRTFDYVIAVCDPEAAERCPVFPAEKKRLHWPFPDPSKADGSMEERKNGVRPIRDDIKRSVAKFIEQLRAGTV
jgi:arsenate reductase